MKHEVSTIAWAFVLVFIAGLYTGMYVGVRTAPSYHDAQVIEKRLREVFCEQAVRKKLMTTCEVD